MRSTSGFESHDFRRVHGLGRDERALLARIDAGVGLVVAEVQERWQRALRLYGVLPNMLRNLENVNRRKVGVLGFDRIDVGEGRVGRAEIDADVHACHSLAHVELELPATAVFGDTP